MPNWKKVIVSGSDASLNSLDVISSLTASGLIYPSTDGAINQSIITDGAGNLSFGNPYSNNTVVYGKNLSGGTIPKGTPLYFTGSGTSGNLVGVFPADAGNPARMPAGGIAGVELLDEAEGVVFLDGFINGVDTSAFNSGDLVYVAVGGGYTNVRPTGSTNLVQPLGYVEKVAISNGSGVVRGPGTSNNLPNIQQGYLWVGNQDDVPVAIATSSIQNVVSSSYATTASYAFFATSASQAQNANTASYVLNAVSSSNSQNSNTIYVTGDSSNVDYEMLFNYDNIENGYTRVGMDSGAGFTYNPSTNTLTVDNVNGNASTATSASHALNADTSISASYATNALTASYLENNQIFSNTIVTSSFNNVTSTFYNHNFGSRNILVKIYDTSSNEIIPSSLTLSSNNKVNATFANPQSGYMVIMKGEASTSAVGSYNNTLTASLSHTLNTRDVNVEVYDQDYNKIIPETLTIIDTSTIEATFITPSSGNIVAFANENRITSSFSNITFTSVANTLNTLNIEVAVYDSNYTAFIPDNILVTTSSINIDFATTSSGNIVIIGGNIDTQTSPATSFRTTLLGSTTYTVQHNLDEEFPLVQVYESSSRAQFIPQSVVSIDKDTIQITFSSPFNGYLIVNN